MDDTTTNQPIEDSGEAQDTCAMSTPVLQPKLRPQDVVLPAWEPEPPEPTAPVEAAPPPGISPGVS